MLWVQFEVFFLIVSQKSVYSVFPDDYALSNFIIGMDES